MPNIVFKLGSLDLSQYIRVNQQEGLDLGQGDMIEPAWSDSPLFEGQTLTSIHAKNKELKVPLYLHPPTAPYTNDALNAVVQQVNQALRPVVDLGYTVYAEWRNAQATSSTFFTVQYGRFEPNFNFRITERGWLAGVLHLWVLPYGHTATERSIGTRNAPAVAAQSFLTTGANMFTNASLAGDTSPHFDIRLTVGSQLADDGRIGIISALPIAGYLPIIFPASLVGLSPSAIIGSASGAAATSFLALDSSGIGGAPGAVPRVGQFSFSLAPGSVYAGDNRLLGLVRARRNPFCLRAFDPQGQPIGPTVIASALDGWQLVDYGTLRVPPWMATVAVGVQAYNGPDYDASGMFAPRRAAPGWTKEIGPIFVLPNNSTVFDLDFNSPALAIDGFDGANGAVLGQDQLGNSWSPAAGVYNGNSGYIVPAGSVVTHTIGSAISGDYEIEAVVTFPNASMVDIVVGALASGVVGGVSYDSTVEVRLQPASSWLNVNGNTFASVAIPTFVPGQYHLQVVAKGATSVARLYGPSGAYLGSASGAALTVANQRPGNIQVHDPPVYSGFSLVAGTGTAILEAFRARALASTGAQPRDMLHLYQPLAQNTRMNPSGVDILDLQGRQRGPVQAITLPVPSFGGGMFIAHFPFDQGPANDILDVEVRARERFTYAR